MFYVFYIEFMGDFGKKILWNKEKQTAINKSLLYEHMINMNV